MKFLMKWVGVVQPELVLAKVANIKCPAIVIEFYENNLVFKDPNRSEEA